MTETEKLLQDAMLFLDRSSPSRWFDDENKKIQSLLSRFKALGGDIKRDKDGKALP